MNPGHASYIKDEFYYYTKNDDANIVKLDGFFGNYFGNSKNSRGYIGSFSEYFITMEEHRENKLNKILA